MPTDDFYEDDEQPKPPEQCPSCGNTEFGEYLLGMPPPPDDELLGQMRRDEVRIVGCVFLEDQPFWFCRDCDAGILEDGRLAPRISG